MAEIRVEFGDKIAVVTMDCPPVNALALAQYERLTEVFLELDSTRDANCVVLASASARAFCAGKDLKEFLSATVEDDPRVAAIVRKTFFAIRSCRLPVIAAVNGPALGAGCGLACVADIRIASERATFGLPEINVGRCGGGAFLARLVTQGVLRKMFFTGQPIDAATAYRVGLVEEVVPPEELMPAAMRLAAVIAAKSPLGLRLGKQSLNEVEFLPVEEGYPIEQGYSTELMKTEDAREATRAVVEKRAPVFVGR